MVTSPWISSSSVNTTLYIGSPGCRTFILRIQSFFSYSFFYAFSINRFSANSASRFKRNSLYRSASFSEFLFFSISLLTWMILASRCLTYSSIWILSAYFICSLSFLCFLVLLSSMTNWISSNLSFSSSFFDRSKALALLSYLTSRSFISSWTVLKASSALNISFFCSMKSCMFCTRSSLGNYTRERVICIATLILVR